jgi:tripartite-type tricarboxylate transporter receptor subunit TctC
MMESSRRRFLEIAGAAAATPAFARNALALDYPVRPLRWIVGFPPGGGTDIVSRIMAQWLSERLGQSVVVDNRPGASTNISIQAAATSPPDGYTLVCVTASTALNVSLYENLPFNLLRDIAPVAGLIDFSLVMVVSPKLPVRTVPEFIAYAKANPRRISMASYGTGTTSHLAGELFKVMTGVNMVHVPYRGEGLALTDMMGSQVQVMFATLTGALALIRSGKLRLLAVCADTRSEFVPDAPTVPSRCRATWRIPGPASAFRAARRRTSSRSSIPRSTPASPTPGPGRGSRRPGRRRSSIRRTASAPTWRRRSTNGEGSFALPA